MQEKHFLFTTIIQEHEETILPVLRELDHLLNEELNLSIYSETIQHIAYAFILLEENSESIPNEAHIEYDDDDALLFLQLPISLDAINLITKDEIPSLSVTEKGIKPRTLVR